MRFIGITGLFGLLLGAVLWPTVSRATHVRAGEITTRRVSETTLTYEITFTAYYDEITGRDAAAAGAERYTICFGDGTSQVVQRDPKRLINRGTTSINTYRVRHTYSAPNPYTISVTVENRNANTKNLSNSSQDISFFVSTTILINPGLGLNSTPVLLNPPLDSGRVGQRFTHNPVAFDADGDSLAFRLSVPKQGIGAECPRSREIPTYQDPTRFSRTSEAGGTSTFTINPTTGELSWDAPGEEGQYNFAFIVEEWRNGVLIGEVTRDMQIVVVDSPNRRPLIQPLADLCVEAGTRISQTITATDPDGHRVIITGFGGVFNVGPDGRPLGAGDAELIDPAYAQLTPAGAPVAQPATANFSWETNCNHIREAPYDVVFKVTDVPPRPTPALVSFQTLRIRVVGPSVKNLTARATASAGGRAIQLSWDPYTCGPAGSQLIIYRREGCTSIPPQPCLPATLTNYGYREVIRVPIGTTTYTDTSALRRGVSYSYRLVAEYRDRNGQFVNGGVSKASEEACLELPLLVPVMTQVTVDSTSETRGRISVRWSRPIGLQPGDLAGPYQYRLQRATGLAGTDWATITTVNTTLDPSRADTVYVDRGSSVSALNTVANPYRYRVEFYYTEAGQLTRLDVTEPASSVRLSATAAQRRIALSWTAAVPWSNDNQTHDLYRSRSGPQGPFNRIATVSVQGPATYTYTDTGEDRILVDGNTSLTLSADSSYCYRVMTRGRYGEGRLVSLGTLENYSQVLCAQPADSTRPCAPRLGLDSLSCAGLDNESFCTQSSFTNNLRWQATAGPTCDPNIASYKLYYARYRQDTLGVLASIPAPTSSFAHSSLTTVAGCYYVTAVSSRGLESLPSNKVCNDACPYFALPNVFTPNGDGKNDVFQPMRCARFVEEVQLIVYNRWGAKVYETTGAVLAWNGKTGSGADLPSGQYYYQATVRYAVVDRGAAPQVFKGWVQILREGVSMR